MHNDNQIEIIKDYYGKVLKNKNDLKTTACCSAETMPSHLAKIIGRIHEEVRAKFYGCGVPLPPALDGLTVLDLGSGSGRDCFALSPLVGATGRVIGVDMTDEQIGVAKKYVTHHTKEFGLAEANVEFRQGFIEDLRAADIADESIDLVVSNCVINLSPRKDKVFSEILRCLKPGGEMYFSDVFVDRRLSEAQRTDDVLLGECLGGAMYFEDFRRLLAQLGVADFRTVAKTEIQMTNPDVAKKVGNARFFSITIRAFKLPLEDRCEDYGQVARYLGGIDNSETGFVLDDHHYFEKGRRLPVCSNTAAMLQQSRYGKFFAIEGDLEQHYGLFDCGPVGGGANEEGAASCC